MDNCTGEVMKHYFFSMSSVWALRKCFQRWSFFTFGKWLPGEQCLVSQQCLQSIETQLDRFQRSSILALQNLLKFSLSVFLNQFQPDPIFSRMRKPSSNCHHSLNLYAFYSYQFRRNKSCLAYFNIVRGQGRCLKWVQIHMWQWNTVLRGKERYAHFFWKFCNEVSHAPSNDTLSKQENGSDKNARIGKAQNEMNAEIELILFTAA